MKTKINKKFKLELDFLFEALKPIKQYLMNNINRQKPRILIVEDEPGIRLGMTYTLLPLSLEIFEASDGVEALKVLSTTEVDLIITDLAMPEMNGLEFIRRLKLLDKKTPVLVMTAHADLIIAKQVKQLGVVGLIDKPWSDETLVEFVSTALKKIGRVA